MKKESDRAIDPKARKNSLHYRDRYAFFADPLWRAVSEVTIQSVVREFLEFRCCFGALRVNEDPLVPKHQVRIVV